MKLYMCDLKDVDNNSMKRIVVGSGNDSSKYCVINIENDIYVIDDVCSHADFSLSQGFLDGKSKEVECPKHSACLLYTSPSPRDRTRSRMPSFA